MKKLQDKRSGLKKLLLLIAFGSGSLCCAFTIACLIWIAHGDKVTFLPLSEWGFGVGELDGINPITHQGTGGMAYYYGIIERVPKHTYKVLGGK